MGAMGGLHQARVMPLTLFEYSRSGGTESLDFRDRLALTEPG
jgi:hypothetical protein